MIAKPSKLIRAIQIMNENLEIARDVIPLIGKFAEQNSFSYLASRLLALIDEITFSDEISINELVQNNYEFLDTMKTVVLILLNRPKEHISLTLKNQLISLNIRIEKLIRVLNSPPFLQRQTLRDSDSPTDKWTEPSEQKPIKSLS